MIARARHTDPTTSHAAAASVHRITERQLAILRTFRDAGPMTDVELAETYPSSSPTQSLSGLRTRRAELVAVGSLEDTGRRRTLPSGRQAIVWGITDRGRFEARETRRP